ncbi:hypothetical protein [Frondihabitans cladoniiphilus]|uniref:Uncharacterized protein n=1 Tax=Frondihabitans cladoniiphilus TaxID=715785 RepID=A0ABP8WFS5_9MICO
MPREITMLSPTEHDLQALADAAEGVGRASEVREIDGGAALQVVTPDGVTLLTVYRPRLISTPGEVERLLPSAPAVQVPVWWTDAVAPLDAEGETGVSIALRLALRRDAVCLVED